MIEVIISIVSLTACLGMFGRALWLRRVAEEKEAAERFRNFQAFAVLMFHKVAKKELKDLSISELRRDFNVTALYNEIGR